MSLIKGKPSQWTALSDFFDDDWIKNKFSNTELFPAINVVENERNFEIEAAIPGFKKNEIHVDIENGVLKISGETEREMEEKDKNFTRKEFSSSSFSQSFTLPENADSEAIQARYENGILRLTLSKNDKDLPPKKEIRIE